MKKTGKSQPGKTGGLAAGENEINWDEVNEKHRKDLQTMCRIMELLNAGGEKAEQAIGEYLDLIKEFDRKYKNRQ